MAGGPRRLMIWLGVPLLLYAGLLVLIYALQDALVFPGAAGGGPRVATPEVPGVDVGWLIRPGGERFRFAAASPGTRAEPQPTHAVLLLFLGNGEDLRSGVPKARELTDYGVATVIPEYPGYGESEGTPAVASVFECAEVAAAHAAAQAQRLGVPLFVGGTSLGSFPAVYLASRGVGARLLLAAPPTSIAESGSRRYPWLPVKLLVRHCFDSLALADRVQCPTLVVHGDQDRVVPTDMGERLAAALRGEFVLAAGHGHWWLLSPSGPVGRQVRAFLEAG